MIGFVVTLLIMILGVSIWNFKTLHDMKKLTQKNEISTADSRYYELKYNIQFLVGMSTILIAIVGSLGYSSFKNVESQISESAKKSIEPLMIKVDSISNHLIIKTEVIKGLDSSINSISKSAEKIESAINKVQLLETKINKINSRNILKQNYYIIPSIEIDLSKPGVKTIFYKNLVTNNGDRLPTFKSPPLVFGTQDLNSAFMIFNVTTLSFQITSSSAIVLEDSPEVENKSQVSLMIIEK
jgi:hypothetical protein